MCFNELTFLPFYIMLTLHAEGTKLCAALHALKYVIISMHKTELSSHVNKHGCEVVQMRLATTYLYTEDVQRTCLQTIVM